jgi:hypothetical protein
MWSQTGCLLLLVDDRNIAVVHHGNMGRTIVSIYEVGDSGATGRQVGTGLLIGPQLVLVHPPLDTELAAAGAPSLRVGMAALIDGYHGIEIIDVENVLVSSTDANRPLVALALRGVSVAPITPMARTGVDDPARVVADYLDLIDNRIRGGLGPPPTTADYPWCRVWPDGPGCDS